MYSSLTLSTLQAFRFLYIELYVNSNLRPPPPPTRSTHFFMGLRKQPPPRLENISKSNPRSDARSPKSPNSASSHRATRLNRFPSEDSIYSPDLNTSPAFDLMPLEEAQRSPVGSPASQPPNSWPDNNGRPDDGRSGQYNQYEGAYKEHANTNGHWIQPTLIAGQQSGAAENVWRPTSDAGQASTGELPVQLQSNNPFLKPRSAEHTQDLLDRNEWARDSHATSNSDALSQCMTLFASGSSLKIIFVANNLQPKGIFQ